MFDGCFNLAAIIFFDLFHVVVRFKNWNQSCKTGISTRVTFKYELSSAVVIVDCR